MFVNNATRNNEIFSRKKIQNRFIISFLFTCVYFLLLLLTPFWCLCYFIFLPFFLSLFIKFSPLFHCFLSCFSQPIRSQICEQPIRFDIVIDWVFYLLFCFMFELNVLAVIELRITLTENAYVPKQSTYGHLTCVFRFTVSRVTKVGRMITMYSFPYSVCLM